jgi:sugar phosphate isomerase/epimerase
LSNGLNINDTNEIERQKALKILKEGIDEAYYMETEAFTFLSGQYEVNKKKEAYSALLKSTKELCEYARNKGNMKIILEVFDHSIDKKSLIGPASLARMVAEEVKNEYDNFGLTVDLSHIPLIGENYEEAILPIKEFLEHVHIGNCVKDPSLPAYGDKHPRFGFPGGENDIEQVTDFLKFLLGIGFLNKKCPPIVNFEVKPQEDEDQEIIISNSKRVLNAAWLRV